MKMKTYRGVGILICFLVACTVQQFTMLQVSPIILAETTTATSTPADNTPLYKAAEERHFNAYIQADLITQNMHPHTNEDEGKA